MIGRRNSNMLGVLFAAMLVWALCAPAAAAGRTITVDDDGAAEFKSIQAAIDDANDGDEIVVAPGTYNEAINFSRKAITLRSTDPNDPNVVAQTIIDAATKNSSVVTCSSGEGGNTILDGFTITGGTGTVVGGHRYGGGMYNLNSSPTVRNCKFTANSVSGDGGGMYNRNSNPTVTNCSFAENSAAYAGGGMDNRYGSSPTVAGCNFSQNTAGTNGGGMESWNGGTPTVTNCSFMANQAQQRGGGMFNSYSNPTVTNCNFSGNTATCPEGLRYEYYEETWDKLPDFDSFAPVKTDTVASFDLSQRRKEDYFGFRFRGYIYIRDEQDYTFYLKSDDGSRLYIDGALVVDNDGLHGSQEKSGVRKLGRGQHAIEVQYFNGPNIHLLEVSWSSASWEKKLISGQDLNTYASYGGGMYNDHSSPTVTDCNFNQNTANYEGGGMRNFRSDPNVSKCAFNNNSADYGGGVYNDSRSPTVTDCNFSQNTANYEGGGMRNSNSYATVSNCAFSNNSADYGGGVYNYSGSPTITDCNFTNNSVTRDGGGMYNLESDPNVTGCVFTANVSTGLFGYGGGMRTNQGAANVANCIFSGNRAAIGGGMDESGGGTTVTNCSFAYNYAGLGGGGMSAASDSTTVINCTFNGNTCGLNGGGMANQSSATVTNCTFRENNAGAGGAVYDIYSLSAFTNCIFVNNSAKGRSDSSGGAVINIDSSPTFTNCTFYGNSAPSGQAMYSCTGMLAGSGRPFVSNCIFWGDTPDQIFDGTAAKATTTVIYSNVRGGWPGAFNIDSDPLFVDANAGDLRLDIGSPCIDGGANTYASGTDIDGYPRITDGDGNGSAVVDMGAYEADSLLTKVAEGSGTIQQAIDAARSGAEIIVGPGTYNEAVDFRGKALTLRSSDGAETTIIDATGSGTSAVTCASGEDGHTVLKGFTIRGGSSRNGGGVFCQGSSPTISDCRITGNWAGSNGGGVYCDASDATIVNCLIYANTAGSGGGIYCTGASPTVTNCTITLNSASSGGGLFCDASSSPKVTNCILWADNPTEIYNQGGAPAVSYCDIQGGYNGADNNIDADPLFADTSTGDFDLGENSPCFNAGSNAADAISETDFEGGTRIVFGTSDIGALELDISSRLEVSISPQDASDAGGRWRVAGESEWRDSGEVACDLPPGYYKVECKEAPGWTEPEQLAVCVLADTFTSPVAEYKRVPVFDIGQIPPRDAPHGRKLAFYVYSEQLGPAATLSAVADHLPEGPVYFDPGSGLFTYEPNDIDDRTPFYVTFTAEAGGADPCSQVVEIAPMPDLPSEYEIVSRPVKDLPDANSRDYIFDHEDWIEDPCDPGTHIYFNAAKRATRSVTIAGTTVVFDNGYVALPDGGQYGPYDYSNNVADIHDMTIYAETLVIRDPLRLPQTLVTVHARNLRFEESGCINTTPVGSWPTPELNMARLPWSTTYDGQILPVDGHDGHPGGDITLHIESFDAGSGSGPRFITNGGAGQTPEPGSVGSAGNSVSEARPGWAGCPDNVTFIWFYNYYKHWLLGCRTSEYEYGSRDLPTPDYDAVCAGKPGNGGAGGNVICTLDLSPYVDSEGGQSADPGNGGNNYAGGSGGGPNPAYWATVHHHGCGGEDEYHWYNCGRPEVPSNQQGRVDLKYQARPSAAAPAPSADVPAGPDGQLRHRPAALSWLSPYALKMILAHAKDAYLCGYATQTKEILEEYQDLLGAYMGLPQWEGLPPQWRFEFEQMHQEIVSVLHRIDNGFDYFGNPPNWTPMLSFEALKTAYEREIKHAIRVLYLSYWLQNKAGDLTETQDALKKGRETLWVQTEQLRENYEISAGLLGPLATEAANIAARIGRADSQGCSGLLCQLKRKEAELLRKAEEEVTLRPKLPLWKKALRAVGGIATSTLSAATGPRKGGWAAAGFARGLITEATNLFLAEEDPWPPISSQTDVAKQFNNIEFDEATSRWLDKATGITDVNDIENNGAERYLADLKDSAGEMAAGLYDVKEALTTTLVDDIEVEVELKKLKAEDPQFNKFIDEAMKLMVQKELFNRRLASTMQKVSTLSADITNNILAIDAMNRQAASISRILDPRAIMYVRDLEKRALARLVKYHYYMLKAYEYRLLEPAPKECDLNVQDMFNKMQQIVSADGRLGQTDYDALKVIYEEQLQAVTDAILEKYTWGEEKENSKIGQTSLWPEEIEKLNRGESVTVNLFERGMFEAQRENLRIMEVNVLDIELEESPSGQCPTAYVTLLVDHCGVSDLQLAGQRYQFTHPGGNIYWDTDCYVNGFISPPETSDAQNSLLSILLGGLDPDKIMFYSRPAAWADLTIVRSLTQVYPCSDVKIKSVILGVKYDYKLRDADLKTVIVAAEPNGPDWGLMPYFVVEKPDENGRQDGIGSFRRVYDCPGLTGVKVTAPEVHGCWEFDKWIWTTASGQTATSTNPTLTVGITCQAPKQQSFGARYNYEGPPLSPADFDQSAYVDFTDFDALTRAWHTIPSDPAWDSKYDISATPDNVIDMGDVAVFADNWLTTPQ
ncbi:MAG: hypothetical protein JSU94_06895 [Phycisphaerales bacterium]|nr:MAG: hypothetical protein JSU94_06895 [Phycisphaerales bacterium]